MKFKKFRNSKEYCKANKMQIFDGDGIEYTGSPESLDDLEVESHAWSLLEDGLLIIRIKSKRRH